MSKSEVGCRVGYRLLVGVAMVAPLLGCSAEDRQSSAHQLVKFNQAFELLETIELEEPDGKLIGRLHDLRVDPTGEWIAVLDPMAHRVRLHSRRGGFLAARGGPGRGDGPGEFNVPWSISWDSEGFLWVGEQLNARITRLSGELDLDSVIAFEEGIRGQTIGHVGEHLLIQVRGRPDGLQLDLLDMGGRHVDSFHEPHPRSTAPYWIQFGGPVTAASDSIVAVGFAMEYPIRLYTRAGELIRDDFGHPPPSWRQASVVEAGAFAIGGSAPGTQNPMEWRNSFTRIHALGFAGDSCLIVVHEIPDLVDGPSRATFPADVYDWTTGEKLLEDVGLPGGWLNARENAFFLVAQPPDPWTVEVWGPGARCRGD